MKPKPKHKKPKHRNSGGGGGSSSSPPRPRRRGLPRRGNPPDFWSTVAAVAGGAGSAVLSGLVVNQSILSPEASAIGLIGIGGTTAYFADGHARIVGNGMASAGAGQLALAMMGRRALKGAPPAPAPVAAAPPQQLPPPAAPRLANAGHGGGYVVDVFRDAANQLDMIDEDEWRMGTRDAAPDAYEIEEYAPA